MQKLPIPGLTVLQYLNQVDAVVKGICMLVLTTEASPDEHVSVRPLRATRFRPKHNPEKAGRRG